jgi:hypothetical protein
MSAMWKTRCAFSALRAMTVECVVRYDCCAMSAVRHECCALGASSVTSAKC